MYYTYMLRCCDNSIYTGITTDLARRMSEHSGKNKGGAKYTRSKSPLRLEIVWTSQDRILASKLESQIKKLPRAKKEILIAEPAMLETVLGQKLDCSQYTPTDISEFTKLL